MPSVSCTVAMLACMFLASLLSSSAMADQGMTLALDEEFNTLNFSLWQHEITMSGGGNWEFEYYTNNRTNSYVRDGILYLRPTLTEDDIGLNNVRNGFTMDLWGGSPADRCTQPQFYGCFRTSGAGGNYLNPVKSARIRTVQGFNFMYGHVEIRAKMPRGDWLWPAIWMLPTHNEYGDWPASGEIDIVESRGNPPSYPPGGRDTFGSTLHWGPSWSEDLWSKTHAIHKTKDLSEDFHVYGLIWNETYFGTYFDDESNIVLSMPINETFWSLGGWPSPPWTNPWTGAGKNAPFDRNFYLILNVACGGTNSYFPDGNGKPWSNTDPHAVNAFTDAKNQWYPTWDGENAAMQVDYVKVWSYSK